MIYNKQFIIKKIEIFANVTQACELLKTQNHDF